MRRVLVTGANGFLGRNVAAQLMARGVAVRSAVRVGRLSPGESCEIGEIGPETDWTAALAGCDAVIHTAAIVHRRARVDDLHRVNVAGTSRLAEQAAEAGVRQFVFISSAGVFGAGREAPYTDIDPPAPVTAYTRSKLEAEQALANVPNLDLLILRPPMVYGRSAPGNFARLARLVQSGLPLPLASIRNRRALVHVDDIVAAIGAALEKFRPGSYALAGPEDVSTPQLARGIAAATGKSPLLLPFPPSWIDAGARLTGRGPEIAALTYSFTLDDSRFSSDFDWRPVIGLAEGLRRSLP